ncbi:GNAT family N-acetyltransferase [Chryseobacterium defluvii]|uniref:RimJ/RimL family protein N-acetyltransferase n=1 Tax=Chryseobacterium defluvii TaxID=160396 RepID=A0A495SAB7_9FLAO|nr:GNAT family N-acetyltransferase [Chryseobacterium defluvii]RKS96451.1 RimJ/RimL family protein N-acetyltransferase [Chryseobacterium defluvii]
MIATERLILRKPAKEDFERFFEINNDPKTNMHNPSGPMGFEKAESTFARMLDHWEKHNFGGWTIVEKDNPENIIGFGGLSYKLYGEEEKLNLGYRFAPEAWGKGYATEFSKKTIAFGLNDLNKEEIFGVVRPDNVTSVKVLEKSGMSLAGKLDDVPGQPESLIYIIQK